MAHPTPSSVRRLLRKVLKTSADFEAFCLDCFPQVHTEFTPGMQSTRQVSLLFIHVDLAKIVETLEREYPEAYTKHHNTLVFSDKLELDRDINKLIREQPAVRHILLSSAAATAAFEIGATFWKGWTGALTVVSITILGVTMSLTLHRALQKPEKGRAAGQTERPELALPSHAEDANGQTGDPLLKPRQWLSAERTKSNLDSSGLNRAPMGLEQTESNDLGSRDASNDSESSRGASAYAIPPSIIHDVPNIAQETEGWNWAAVVQQTIAMARGPALRPLQCELVALSMNVPAKLCCQKRSPCSRRLTPFT